MTPDSMGGGMGNLFSIFGNALAVTKQSNDYERFGKEQQKKADAFALKANQVVTQQVENDPAYILKEYLARNGMPGLQKYLSDIDKTTSNQIAVAEDSASSGGQLLSYLASLMGAQDANKNDLYAKSAEYQTQAMGGLADTRYAWQQQYDLLARQERNKLNKIASQYQTAADSNIMEAQNMDSALIGSTFSQMGSLMGGL